MTNDSLTLDELYILQDALYSYKYGRVDKSISSSTKDKIRVIQKKLLSMEKIK